MSPIPRNLVKFTQRIKNPVLRNLTLNLIEEASQKPDMAHFTIAILKPHTTALFATEEQFKSNKAQTAHIYHDEQGQYVGHTLYQERENKSSDE
ncbi:hypothetical protein EYZ11_013106 [Aspergillus tanneri]|uniref:Uncharacterized protein n=1 Tax=Aspergillus tanneri TaxID=1220188 RepID=A0A4S3IYH9_9EURO|nr:hypothetical protein EYZ11_013106 [Aspergillus tanneri]